MNPERRAVIDVGTNSVKLLVAEVGSREVRPLLEQSHQTRLGLGFYEQHRLQPARITQTAQAVSQFAAKARENEAVSLRVIATSAAREATNSIELIRAIQQACGLNTEILSGDQEADLAFRGIATDPALARQPSLLLEVGGGSAQFILGHDQVRDFAQSFPIGSVRLLERLAPADPPERAQLETCRNWLRDFIHREVRPKLLPALGRTAGFGSNTGPLQLVGTGGTASILGCMEAKLDRFDREALEAAPLTLPRVHWHVEHLWSLSLEHRKQIVGLPKNRADVILTGTAIYEAVMQYFELPQLRVSTRGLRFGAVLPS